MPSIIDGLFAGRSGIQSHGVAIATVADNISNSNTVGYKASRADFTDLLLGSLGGGGTGNMAVGSGSTISSVTEVFNQGSLEFTDRNLDLAVDGNGFFVLEDISGARYYSRAGNLKIDADGYLRNQNDLYVLGFPVNGSGGLERIATNQISQENIESLNVFIGGNLDASSALTAQPAAGATYAELSDAASFSTFVDVFDSLGAKHTATVFFYHTAPGTWTASTFIDGGELASGGAGAGTAGAAVQVGTVDLTFSSDGTRTAPVAPDLLMGADWANGATDSSIGVYFDPFTQYASPSSISEISQDGSGAGNVVSLSFEGDGTLFALLDNGETSSMGTLALAAFANPEGLQRRGGSLYAESNSSGEAVLGTPQTGRFGAIEAGALELSTTDLASNFVKLISLQRGFQGSSRTITTVNDLLQELINIV
ncbi:MAG: flagellar hook protein FlgE [Deltaproteobacteria bacterium]|nr:flagellar hook protein FlgE [Deltaproteobacteria bacterium]